MTNVRHIGASVDGLAKISVLIPLVEAVSVEDVL